jgi:hypothetical protein
MAINYLMRLVDEIETMQVRKLQVGLGEGVDQGASFLSREDKPLTRAAVEAGTVGDLEGFTAGQGEGSPIGKHKPWKRWGNARVPCRNAPMVAHSSKPDAINVRRETAEDMAYKLCWEIRP